MGEVLGSYRLIEELSTGGMGTVYRAQHELLGRSAAIKLLRPELSSNDVLVQRFFNEAKAATAIRHPGIVEVYDFGYTDDGRAYIVMELLDGETLKARVDRRGRLTELEAATIGRGIAASLRAAHAKGIVHRDLKPDNVFLVPDADGTGDRAKVLDFGVAKLTDLSPGSTRHTQTGVLMGTPLYMAPEQARAAGAIDHRADLYSLGCILYELLVGQPPFVADGAGEIIAMQLFSEVERPAHRAQVSPQMDALVMRLLEKEPHDRYQHANDVQQALAQIVEHYGVRLSAELASASASMPGVSQSRMPTPMPGPHSSLKLGLIDEAPPEVPPKRSALPIIAGVVTVVLAAAAVFFVLSRGGEDDGETTPAAAAQTSTAPPPKPTPTVVAPPTPAPEPPKPAAAVEPEPPKRVAGKPRTVKRVVKKGDEAPASAGPVTSPSETTTSTNTGGPTTRPGMRTSEGAPIEPDLGEPEPKQPK